MQPQRLRRLGETALRLFDGVENQALLRFVNSLMITAGGNLRSRSRFEHGLG